MNYNPKKPLTEQQINNLSDDQLFEYLDSKSAYLKKNTRPLSAYECKQFSCLTSKNTDKEITIDQIKIAEDIGKENAEIMEQKILETMQKKGLVKPNLLIKNHKTNRSQWFD